jgi:hypothetical protein
LTEISQRYVSYSQANDLNLRANTIVIPTGDGAAIGFPFGGLHEIHLRFALTLLERTSEARSAAPCEKFNENGWCHCHPYFNLRIGVADGRAIVYKDVNSNYNMAGTVVNYAARVMGIVDGNQVAFTADAYRQIVDMVDDPALADRFREYPGVTIKHGERISLYQYIEPGVNGLNIDEPVKLLVDQNMRGLMEEMNLLTTGMLNMTAPPADPRESLQVSRTLMELFKKLGGPSPTTAPVIGASKRPVEEVPTKDDQQTDQT